MSRWQLYQLDDPQYLRKVSIIMGGTKKKVSSSNNSSDEKDIFAVKDDDDWEVLTKRLSRLFKVMYLIRLVLVELVVYLILYYIINLIYRFGLNEEQQEHFAKLAAFFEESLSSFGRDLTFLLGFYVSLVAKRWWDQYRLLPWPDNLAFTLAGFVVANAKDSLHYRQTVLRYSLLSYVLCIRRFSSNLQRHLPSLQSLMDLGLVKKGEAKKLVVTNFNEDSSGEVLLTSNWWLPLVWSASLIKYGKLHNIIPADGKEVMAQLLKFRHNLEEVESHVHVSIPLVYKLVVTAAVYVYFLLTLIGSQSRAADEVDLYFPLFTVFKLVLFVGWLKVAASIEKPFGEDDADFHMFSLLTRHIRATRAIVEQFDVVPPPYDANFYPAKEENNSKKKEMVMEDTEDYMSSAEESDSRRRSRKRKDRRSSSDNFRVVDEYR